MAGLEGGSESVSRSVARFQGAVRCGLVCGAVPGAQHQHVSSPLQIFLYKIQYTQDATIETVTFPDGLLWRSPLAPLFVVIALAAPTFMLYLQPYGGCL